MIEQIKQQLIKMRLEGMLLALEEQAQHSSHDLCFEERLALLVDKEYWYRENKKLANRLKQAKLRSSYTFEQIDYRFPRNLNKSQIKTLLNDNWIKQRRNILITGPTGTGKTFLSCAIAHKACLNGFNVRHYRLLPLLHDIVIAYRENRFHRFMQMMAKIDILVIDDFGMMNMDAEQKRLLLEILDGRYESRSTIITSQLSIHDWYHHINDPLIADAFLDRLLHLSLIHI